jgi:hypothetical protein
VAESITPFARALYLCDGHFGYSGGKTDLLGLFNAIRTKTYPHRARYFCAFAQLVGGLGDVPFFFDITNLANDELIRTTDTQIMYFPSRTVLIQCVMAIENCVFPEPGIYTVELFCNNTCVADVPLHLQAFPENES